MKNTKSSFTNAAENCEGFKAWFIEEGYDKSDYVIEIWTKEGYTIGDNEATTERIDVIHNEVTPANGWYRAIKALETIKPIMTARMRRAFEADKRELMLMDDCDEEEM